MLAFPLLAAAMASSAPAIPVCEGLTIVTAVVQESGDYESIKRITSVTEEDVTLHYSNERLVSDFLSSDPPKLVRYEMDRTVAKADLESATLYLQQYDPLLPVSAPSATAISISSDVFRRLKRGASAELGIFLPFTERPSLNRDDHPNLWDNALVAPLTKISDGATSFSVLVDSRQVTLPAIEVGGDYFGDRTRLVILDDEKNPLVLQYRFGVGSVSVSPEVAKMLGISEQAPADRERFDVIKIETNCAGRAEAKQQPASGAGDLPAMEGSLPEPDLDGEASLATQLAEVLEAEIEKDGAVDLHAVYFSFGSARLRRESDVTLTAVAEMLKRNPDWRISIVGHTDNVGGDVANLKLSRARAFAVQQSLVSRWNVAASRMTSDGFGEGAPVADNASPAGRARNRRVEIVKQ